MERSQTKFKRPGPESRHRLLQLLLSHGSEPWLCHLKKGQDTTYLTRVQRIT